MVDNMVESHTKKNEGSFVFSVFLHFTLCTVLVSMRVYHNWQ